MSHCVMEAKEERLVVAVHVATYVAVWANESKSCLRIKICKFVTLDLADKTHSMIIKL